MNKKILLQCCEAFLKSNLFEALSNPSKLLYLFLLREKMQQQNEFNDGVMFSYQKASESLNCSKRTVSKAFKELEANKLLEIEKIKGISREKCFYRFVNDWQELDKEIKKIKTSSKSKGEKIIIKFLQRKNVKFEKEKSFNSLLSKKQRKLFFDFAIYYKPEKYFIVELDGKRHFDKENYPETYQNDLIKNEFCKNNNILIYRIEYYDNSLKSIKQILRKLNCILKLHKVLG